MPQLEVLLIGHNPKFTRKFRRTKEPFSRLSINATLIKEFPSDLTALENLESIGLDHNEFKRVPEPILTIPNLKRLGLNNNKLTDLKFIDERLAGLQSIYFFTATN